MLGKRRTCLAILVFVLMMAATTLSYLPSDTYASLPTSGNRGEQCSIADTAMNVTGPGIIWRAQVSGNDGFTTGSNRTSYAVHTSEWRFDPNDLGRIATLEARTPDGKLEWIKQFDVMSVSGPVYGPNDTIRLLTTSSHNSSNATLYNLNSQGNIIWECSILSKEGAYFDPSIDPIIDSDGTTYFSLTEVTQDGQSLSDYYSICAVSSSGSLEWRDYFDLTTGIFNIAIGSNDTIYVLAEDIQLYALSNNGTLLWNLTCPYPLTTTWNQRIAVGSSGNIFICADYGLFAVDDSGILLWNRSLPGRIFGGFALGEDDTVYLWQSEDYYSRETGSLCAFESNGQLIWRKEMRIGHIAPIVDHAGNIIVANDDTIYGLDLNGSAVWSYDAGGLISNIVLGDEGTLFFLVIDSSSRTILVASHGIPRVTWVDWIQRNILVVVLVVIGITSLSYLAWKKTRRK